MIIATVYILAVLLFCVSFYLVKIVDTSRHVLAIASNALAIFSDNGLDDLAREKAIQKLALSMVKHSFILIFKVLITTLFTVLPLWLASIMNLATLGDISQFASRLDVLIMTTMIAILPFALFLRGNTSHDSKINNRFDRKAYSGIARGIHNLAFGSNALQEMLNDIEHTLLSKTWKNVKAEKPVFITSLPRAGTTIILESLSRLPGLATHTYRDMPFILTPVLWHKLSRKFHNRGIPRERAHGDGLSVSEDSPEAFEEVLWKKYFANHYTSDGILLWNSGDSKFHDYFHEHMKKIISLRWPERIESGRYISKNNANIARIKAIKSMFPDAFIIVPLRNPAEHAISLWLQHHNFLKQHAKDDFARKYMGDIGHYEFGLLHRPILFPYFEALTQNFCPKDLDYWIAYWISAFEYLSGQKGIGFLSYETLCQSGVAGLTTLCDYLKVDATEQHINDAARAFHAPPVPRLEQYAVNAPLINRANDIYNILQGRCLLKNPLTFPA